MGFDGSGQFDRVHNFVADRDADIPITASRVDAELDRMATGLSTCITKDGQTLPTANIPFNDKRLTGLGDATAATDAVNRQTGDARWAQLSATETISGSWTFSAQPDFGSFSATGASNGKQFSGSAWVLESSRDTNAAEASHIIFYNQNGQVESITTEGSATKYTPRPTPS